MRVLIATVTVGGGHLQAAAAIEEAWRSWRARDALERVDIFDFGPPLYKKLYNESYLKLVEHAPEVYAMLFKATDNPELARKLRRFRRTLSHGLNLGFVRHLKKTRPQIVICPHYLPLEILGSLDNDRDQFNPLAVSVVTDFEAHALWMEVSVDFYCVAADSTKARLVARGVSADRVAVTGIPISAKFSEPLDAALLRRRFGLRDDLPVLLVLGGGFGLGPVAKMLEALDQVRKSIQVVVVAGRNQELRQDLATHDFQNPTRVLGFVTNMHEWMTVADLILTKPGGLTSSESLALGRPLLIFNPIPGQESANSDFLLERGAAAKVNALEDLPYRIGKLLGSRKLHEMAAKARQLGRPQAALDVCRAVFQQWQRRGR